MAAYAAICSLAKTIEHLLIIVQTHPHRTSAQLIGKEIQSLCETTNFLRAFLDVHPHKATDDLEARIRDEANKAQDVIELHLVPEHLRSSNLAADDDAITVPVTANTLQRLCHELQRVNADMSSTMEKVNNIISKPVPGESLSSIIINDYSSSRIQIEPASKEKVFGLADEFYKLKRLFMGSSSLKVLPIVGRAGLGKTTLARKFYNDTFTSKRFDIRCWVTVSADYSARDVLEHLATSIKPFITEPRKREESIEQYVHKHLKGKKFFIVLDDVWGMEVLEFLLRILPDNKNRSRILLTTRLQHLAAEAVPKESMFLQMNLMSFEEIHDLLVHKVFKQEPCPNKLKDFVRSVALRCGGWPLITVLLAGIMSTLGQSQDRWLKFLDVLHSFDVDEADDGYTDKMFLSIMSLSYKCLPHRLRSYFLYMGAFPEDYEIIVSNLTKIWSAQGLLQGSSISRSSSSSEAEKYLHELVKRNLVSVLRIKSSGGIKSCILHDEVRDFCIKKAREEGFFHFLRKKSDSGNQSAWGHRFSGADETLVGSRIKTTSDLDNLIRICSSSGDDTRTIVCYGHGRIPLISIGRFRLLKVLNVTNVEFKSFPMEIFGLFLLNLLSLNHIPELPPNLSNLQYLETLIIHPKDSSSTSKTLPYQVSLPFEFWTMQMIRHLVSFCFCALPNLEGENSALINLETLSAVMNLDCSENMMKMIPNVKKLGIFYFGVERMTHSVKNLEQLHQLEKLKLWVLVPFSSPQIIDLGYPVTLKKLNLRGIRFSSQDMNVIGRLPNLEVLKLKQNTFEGDEWKIDFGEFPKLIYLLLEVPSLTHWVSDGDVKILPTLETLSIRSCKGLLEIPKGVGEISTLKLIEVVGGKHSLAESAGLVLENQRNNGNSRIEVLITGTKASAFM